MQAMRYDITLPTDYDMTMIRERVAKSGHLMDGFEHLLFKAYLICEKAAGEQENSYSPLYVWKDATGMNEFIFGGYYDNILRDFGWQAIEIAIVSDVQLSTDFAKSGYVTEEVVDIVPSASLTQEDVSATIEDGQLGKLVVYNPDKWKKVSFVFYKDKPVTPHRCFEILHLSQ